ncbi:MAG: mechanosensitive ion channel family protein [Akkermansiaceae bacterium]
MPFLESIWAKLYALVNDSMDHWQWGAIAGGFIIAAILLRILNKTLFAEGKAFTRFGRRFFKPGRRIGGYPIVLTLTLWGLHAAFQQKLDGAPYIQTIALLATAYAAYRLATALAKTTWAPRFVGSVMFLSFALHLFGALTPLIETLQNLRIPLGDLRISLWAILSGIGSLFVLLWVASLGTLFVDTAVSQQKEIPPSIRVLLGKLARFIFYLSAILIALKIGGIDLGVLTVFTGALGLGVGFGLQKVVSNLISGIIILLDKSVKPGDVIEIDGSYGWINSLRTRYVSVLTRDRKEHLIPNEDFITNPVINWSFSDDKVRIKANIGISYKMDVQKAIDLCVKATAQANRVLETPEPKCLLMGFGDSAIDLQIRFWIRDAHQGVANIRSEVLLNIWHSFKEHGIEIPFPQREIKIISEPVEGE